MSRPYWHDALPSSSATVIQHRRANATAKDGASRKRISRDPAHFHLPPLPLRETADDPIRFHSLSTKAPFLLFVAQVTRFVCARASSRNNLIRCWVYIEGASDLKVETRPANFVGRVFVLSSVNTESACKRELL